MVINCAIIFILVTIRLWNEHLFKKYPFFFTYKALHWIHIPCLCFFHYPVINMFRRLWTPFCWGCWLDIIVQNILLHNMIRTRLSLKNIIWMKKSTWKSNYVTSENLLIWFLLKLNIRLKKLKENNLNSNSMYNIQSAQK